MPTYLTPGVYVEEIPSASKPIEGVGTSIAAFVGLAPGGPVNTPMRISNWTQFAEDLRRSPRARQRAVHGRARTSRTPSTASSRTAAACAGSCASAAARRRQPPPGRAAGRGRRRRRGAARGRARTASTATSRSRSPRRPRPRAATTSRPTRRQLPDRGHRRNRARGVRRPDPQEGPQQHRHQGQRGLEADQDRGDRRVAARDAAARPRAPTGCPCRRPPVEKLSAGEFEGDVARREGMGSLAAIDEVTMVCAPDLMMLAADGDDAQMRDVQGKMIAHCESAKDRMAILDCAARPAAAGGARVADEHRRLRLQVRDALLPVDRGHGPAHPAADDGAAVAATWPASGRAPTAPAACTRRRPTRSCSAPTASASRSRTRSRAGSTGRASTASARSPGRGIRVWGARTLSSDPEWRYINVRRLFNYVSESIMEGTQWAVFEPNDERLWIQAADRGRELPHPHLARGRPVRGDARRRRSTSSATPRPTRPRSSRPGRSSGDRHLAGQAGGVRDLPDQPVHGRRHRGQRASAVPTQH